MSSIGFLCNILPWKPTFTGFPWPGKPQNLDLVISTRDLGTGFFETIGMKLTAGRFFYPNGIFDSSNTVITASLAHGINNRDAIGQTIQISNYYSNSKRATWQFVGIIDDSRYGNMYSKSSPVIFFCQNNQWNHLIYVRLKKENEIQQAMAKIAGVIHDFDPAYPFQYRFVDDQFDELFKNEVLMSRASTILSSLAIAISCLGLFGSASCTATRRLKEIGIRKVLGASVTNLTGLLSKDFIIPDALSSLIAFPPARWYMNDWLQQFEYRISLSWMIFFFSGILALAIAAMTISLQTIRAANANPARSLRDE